jgi:hypothetical protein
MSEFKDMAIADAMATLGEAVGDLFYSSLEHQFDDNFPMAHRHAQAFHALIAVYRHLGYPLPEPFDKTPLRTLAADFLSDLKAQALALADMLDDDPEMDDDEDNDEPEPWKTPDEGPWLI